MSRYSKLVDDFMKGGCTCLDSLEFALVRAINGNTSIGFFRSMTNQGIEGLNTKAVEGRFMQLCKRKRKKSRI